MQSEAGRSPDSPRPPRKESFDAALRGDRKRAASTSVAAQVRAKTHHELEGKQVENLLHRFPWATREEALHVLHQENGHAGKAGIHLGYLHEKRLKMGLLDITLSETVKTARGIDGSVHGLRVGSKVCHPRRGMGEVGTIPAALRRSGNIRQHPAWHR
jgi:hypothetical protein